MRSSWLPSAMAPSTTGCRRTIASTSVIFTYQCSCSRGQETSGENVRNQVARRDRLVADPALRRKRHDIPVCRHADRLELVAEDVSDACNDGACRHEYAAGNLEANESAAFGAKRRKCR